MSDLSLNFQPWRDDTVIEELRDAFYPLAKRTSPDGRREACDTVSSMDVILIVASDDHYFR